MTPRFFLLFFTVAFYLLFVGCRRDSNESESAGIFSDLDTSESKIFEITIENQMNTTVTLNGARLVSSQEKGGSKKFSIASGHSVEEECRGWCQFSFNGSQIKLTEKSEVWVRDGKLRLRPISISDYEVRLENLNKGTQKFVFRPATGKAVREFSLSEGFHEELGCLDDSCTIETKVGNKSIRYELFKPGTVFLQTKNSVTIPIAISESSDIWGSFLKYSLLKSLVF